MSSLLQIPVYPPIELYLNSADAGMKNDYLNDVTFQLPRPVLCPQGYQVYLQVLSYSIPHNFTIVNNYNNHITINGYDYTLAAGNYSIYQLVGVLTKLDPAVQCSFDSITLKVSFTSAEPLTLSGPLLGLLGVPQDSNGTSISSAATVNMAGLQSIYISTDLTSSNANIDSMLGSDSVLCRVAVNVPPSQIISFQDYSGRSGLLLDDTQLSSIRLLLTDEANRPLLASINWTIALQARFIYTGAQALQVDRPLALSNGIKSI
jgi:hypothetical protein